MARGSPAAVIGLDEFRSNVRDMMKIATPAQLVDALVEGARIIERAAKLNIKRHDLILTGELRRSVFYIPVSSSRSKSAAVIVGTSKIYAAVHEFGAVITPKRARMLAWKDDGGRWIFAKMVKIPARPYLRPAVDMNRDLIIREVSNKLRDLITGAIP